MPLETRDVDGGLGCIVIGKGIVSEKEFLDTYNKHLTQDAEKFKRYRYSLTDYTAVTEGELSREALEAITALNKNAALVNPDIVIAGVASQDLFFGLLRMAQARRDDTGWESMAFRQRQDAEAWIRERLKDKYAIEALTFR